MDETDWMKNRREGKRTGGQEIKGMGERGGTAVRMAMEKICLCFAMKFTRGWSIYKMVVSVRWYFRSTVSAV